jgi:hypothetical protein
MLVMDIIVSSVNKQTTGGGLFVGVERVKSSETTHIK